ncbi:MAG TPA: class I SAM-dependent methyltransferase [Candidatus Nanopelagicales bacterium]|nr:class I SAM-dependent methyltransferase [Candidatus Nanopelagicales bacterium]
MDLDTVAALAGGPGRELLAAATRADEAAHAEAAAGRADAVDPLRAAATLRAANPAVDPALVAAVLTQVRLRRRARPRLGGLADRLLLTEDGLEQATRTSVADLRAQRYAAAGATHVADLGCGLGLDAAAFARAGLAVTAVERDPVVAALARHNLAALGHVEIDVIEGDITVPALLDAVLPRVDAAFVDPARRDTSRRRGGRSARVADPQSWSPPWSWVEAVAVRVPRTAAKVAPGVDHAMIPRGGSGTWTSVDGQLVEAEIAWKALTAAGTRRRAVMLRGGKAVAWSAPDDLADEEPPPVGRVGDWIVEPDDALVRAGLVAMLARDLDGRLLDPRVAYVTCDSDPRPLGPRGAAYRVRHALRYDLRELRSVLVSDGIGHVVVKKRATSLDVDDVRRRLALPTAPARATVLLTRIGDDPWAFVCDAV